MKGLIFMCLITALIALNSIGVIEDGTVIVIGIWAFALGLLWE